MSLKADEFFMAQGVQLKLVFLLLLAQSVLGISVFAQHWGKVGNFNYYPKRLIGDTSADLLYAFGEFDSVDSKKVSYAACFNGTAWDTIDFLQGHYPGLSMLRLHDSVMFGINPVYLWDGTKLDTIAIFDYGGAAKFYSYKNDVYVMGGFDSINGIAASYIAKWLGGDNWAALDTTKWTGVAIADAVAYNGDLYIGGNMWANGLERIARWDGVRWWPLSNGITGSIAGVGNLEVYNNELYVAGTIFKSAGNAGDGIVRWDGTSWSDAGGGMSSLNAAIYDLQIYNGYLYACGQFTITGGMPIKGIARWDGHEWCGLGQTTQSNYTINCMGVYQNELYVGGPFIEMNGDTLNRIAKWTGGNFVSICGAISGMSESLIEDVLVFPNPASTWLQVTGMEATGTGLIYSVDGRLVKELWLDKGENEIDISALSTGMYVVQLKSGTQQVVRKFVKE